MHPEARQFVAEVAADLEPATFVIEIGSRNVNGDVRDLIPLADDGLYLGVDRTPGRGVDLVADAHQWRPDAKADLVICCEVLEHDERPYDLVKRIAGFVAKGGTLLVTAASPPRAPHCAACGRPLDDALCCPVHHDPQHYANIEPDELAAALDLDGDDSKWSGTVTALEHGDVQLVARRK